jgi:hypothetical protein
MIDLGLEFGPSGGQQGFAVEFGGQGWSSVDMAQVCRSTAHARASHLREFYRQANSGERNEVADDRKH